MPCRAATSDANSFRYGPNYERLMAIKKKYDPKNFFCMNQNIKLQA
jgi:hypothetical protein